MMDALFANATTGGQYKVNTFTTKSFVANFYQNWSSTKIAKLSADPISEVREIAVF